MPGVLFPPLSLVFKMKLMVLIPGFAESWKTLKVFPTGFMLSGIVSNSFAAVATVCGVFVTMRKAVSKTSYEGGWDAVSNLLEYPRM